MAERTMRFPGYISCLELNFVYRKDIYRITKPFILSLVIFEFFLREFAKLFYMLLYMVSIQELLKKSVKKKVSDFFVYFSFHFICFDPVIIKVDLKLFPIYEKILK